MNFDRKTKKQNSSVLYAPKKALRLSGCGPRRRRIALRELASEMRRLCGVRKVAMRSWKCGRRGERSGVGLWKESGGRRKGGGGQRKEGGGQRKGVGGRRKGSGVRRSCGTGPRKESGSARRKGCVPRVRVKSCERVLRRKIWNCSCSYGLVHNSFSQKNNIESKNKEKEGGKKRYKRDIEQQREK